LLSYSWPVLRRAYELVRLGPQARARTVVHATFLLHSYLCISL
jgi:hypothetical protein